MILYLHGGGYCFCSPLTHRGVAAALAREADARAFSLAYRLAPEHPFPAAVDDALAAYRELLDEGVAPERIVVAGDSSGGGLALALLLSLRDAGAPMPAGAVLFSPWTDLAATGASLEANDASDVMLSAVAVRNRAITLATPPPTIPSPRRSTASTRPAGPVHPGQRQRGAAGRRRARGQQGERGRRRRGLQVWRRLPHAWATLTPMLPEARAAIKEAGGFIRKVAP